MISKNLKQKGLGALAGGYLGYTVGGKPLGITGSVLGYALASERIDNPKKDVIGKDLIFSFADSQKGLFN